MDLDLQSDECPVVWVVYSGSTLSMDGARGRQRSGPSVYVQMVLCPTFECHYRVLRESNRSLSLELGSGDFPVDALGVYQPGKLRTDIHVHFKL